MNISHRLFELEIDPGWWIWRGYHPYSRIQDEFIDTPELECREYGDPVSHEPMDEPQFDEEGAFPLLKPSIDVLGVPCRSRKQRGWYQVQSFPPPVASSRNAATDRASAAARLPMEMIFKIGWSVGSSHSTTSHMWVKSPTLRHELASWARVCRHWAKVIQPRLFAGVTISSNSEMTQLLEIRRTSLTELARYNTRLELLDSLGTPPFTHLTSPIKAQYTKYDWGVYNSLAMTGPLPASQGPTLRSIHARVPRSLPCSTSSFIGTLMLQHIHFRSPMDLLRLVSELPDLGSLTGMRLTWPTGSTLPPVPPMWMSHRPHVRGCQMIFIDCTAGQFCRWLAFLMTPRESFSNALGALMRQIDQWLRNITVFNATIRGVDERGEPGIGACSTLPPVSLAATR